MATALTPLAANLGLPVLLVMRACMGVGEGVAMPAMNNLLSRYTCNACTPYRCYNLILLSPLTWLVCYHKPLSVAHTVLAPTRSQLPAELHMMGTVPSVLDG